MSSDLYWLCLLTFIAWHITACNASITDRSRSQFDHYFPTFEQYIRPQILINCSQELRDYQNYSIPDAPGIRGHAQRLTGCILDVLGELDKASMAITGILLALLPVGLVNLGPSIAELSLLSARRPILAALLGFGAMSPNPSLPMEFADLVERTPMKRSRYALFKKTPFLVKIAVSVVEYAIALAAASNCFYQIWRLTYRAVSLAPVAVYLRGLPEEATLFGWVALNLPIHLIGFATFSLAYAKTQSSHGDIIRPGFYRWLLNELTPCMYGNDLFLEPRKGKVGVLQETLGSSVRLFAGLHIILGSVLLGSVIFVLLADSLPLIYTFVGSAVFTRLVLTFELEGIRSTITIKHTEVTENSEEIHYTMSRK